jgi:polysaccharide biosynthesis transport protein
MQMDDMNAKAVGDYIKVVKRRKWSLLIPFLVVFALAAVVALVLPPIYRSTSTILIEDQEVPRELVMATVTSYAEQRLQTITQRVMSTTRLLEIINRFNLYAEERQKKTTEEVIEKMRKDIKFTTINADVVDRRTGRPTAATIAFTLSYDGESAPVVSQVANVLASLYLEENLKQREQQTEGTSKFLGDEAETIKKQLMALEARIAAFKQKNLEALPELLGTNLGSMDRIDRDLDQLKDQLRTLREKESYLRAQLASIPSEGASQDKMLLKELKAKLVQLRSRASDRHPDVIKAKAEIAELEARVEASVRANPEGAKKEAAYLSNQDQADNPAYVNLASQLAGTISDVDSVKRQIEEQTKKRESYRRRTEATPRVDEEYKNLMVERNNAQLKYDDLMKKTMEAKVGQGLEKGQLGERFTIIDPARLPEKPVKPNIPVILLIGAFLGIGAGVGTASLKEYGDHSVRNERDLTALVPVAVLASIPEILTEKDRAHHRKKAWAVAGGAVAAVVVVVLILHFLVMDLDVVWARLARKYL